MHYVHITCTGFLRCYIDHFSTESTWPFAQFCCYYFRLYAYRSINIGVSDKPVIWLFIDLPLLAFQFHSSDNSCAFYENKGIFDMEYKTFNICRRKIKILEFWSRMAACVYDWSCDAHYLLHCFHSFRHCKRSELEYNRRWKSRNEIVENHCWPEVNKNIDFEQRKMFFFLQLLVISSTSIFWFVSVSNTFN